MARYVRFNDARKPTPVHFLYPGRLMEPYMEPLRGNIVNEDIAAGGDPTLPGMGSAQDVENTVLKAPGTYRLKSRWARTLIDPEKMLEQNPNIAVPRLGENTPPGGSMAPRPNGIPGASGRGGYGQFQLVLPEHADADDPHRLVSMEGYLPDSQVESTSEPLKEPQPKNDNQKPSKKEEQPNYLLWLIIGLIVFVLVILLVMGYSDKHRLAKSPKSETAIGDIFYLS